MNRPNNKTQEIVNTYKIQWVVLQGGHPVTDMCGVSASYTFTKIETQQPLATAPGGYNW